MRGLECGLRSGFLFELQLLVDRLDVDCVLCNSNPFNLELLHLLALFLKQFFDQFFLLVAFKDWVFLETIDFLLLQLAFDLISGWTVDYHAEELLHRVIFLPFLVGR